MKVRVLLLLGLAADAVRWHLGSRTALRESARGVGYRLRPYCWRLDDRHWRWQHDRCRCAPGIVFTLTADTTAFDEALARLEQRLPPRTRP